VNSRQLDQTEDLLQSISELNRQQRFGDVVHILNSFDPLTMRSLDIAHRSQAHFEFAHACYRSGFYFRALCRVRVALRIASMASEMTLLGRYKNLYGLVLQKMGRVEDAIEEFAESYVFRKNARQFEDICGSLVNLSLAHFLRGDLFAARAQILRARECAEKFNSQAEVSICERNLLLIHIFIGEFRQAKEILKSHRYPALSKPEKGIALCREGTIEAFGVQHGRAASLLNRALSNFRDTADARNIAICLEFLGLNEYFAGNYAKAREYYDQVLAMPEPTASAVAQTLRMLTDVEIAQNNWEAAKTTAARAETAITKISERIELGALWRAYGHIYTHEGNHAEARSFFAKSIELLRQLGARYELALSHFDAGRSACHSAEERLEHLRQAKALFLEMEVPKRVAQVDKALTALEAQAPSAPDSKRRSLTIKTKAAKQIPEIIAVSHAMAGIMKTVERIKDRDMTVLITGETGTGKDLLAEYIHYSSVRAHNQYCVVNSATLPENLLEAELFGYTRGAFSGAARESEGLIASADGGTFCFDEIGEIPIAVQAKLLRVIDTKIVRQLGSSVDRRIDVRFIALTNRNLEQMIAEGAFRSDLYHRLGQMPIHLPPLRARCEDIMPLIESLLAKLDLSIDHEAIAAGSQLREVLESYAWPGNVREMIAIVTRIAALRDSNGHSDIVQLLLRELDSETPEATDRQRLFLALQRHNGNKSKVAEEIGIPRTTLISQLRKLKL
jgi:transcriptional regulator with GAF, ATPase, and Fis domain